MKKPRIARLRFPLKGKPPSPALKERGNNGANRKVYDNIEEVLEEILPSCAGFDEKAAVFLFHHDVIRHGYIPPLLLKLSPVVKYRMVGSNKFIANPDTLFSTSPELVGEEVFDDITGLIGQYAHGNGGSKQH